MGLQFFKKASSGKKLNLQRYFIRRLIRLEPPYIAALVLFAIALATLGTYGVQELLYSFLASLTYCHYIIFGRSSLISVVLWTLEIEFQFYILAPLLFYIYKQRIIPAMTIFFLLIITFLASTVMMGDSYLTLLSQGHFFVLGAALHLIIPKIKEHIENIQGIFSLPFFLLTLVFLFQFQMTSSSFGINSLKLGGFLVLFTTAIGNKYVRNLLSVKFIYLTGGMCYSIYLLHYPLLSILSKLFTPTSQLQLPHTLLLILIMAICLSITWLISSIFFICIERPFMNPALLKAVDIRWPFKKDHLKT